MVFLEVVPMPFDMLALGLASLLDPKGFLARSRTRRETLPCIEELHPVTLGDLNTDLILLQRDAWKAYGQVQLELPIDARGQDALAGR